MYTTGINKSVGSTRRQSSSDVSSDRWINIQGKGNQGQNMESYRVVFWGQCTDGYDLGDVSRAFAKRFKVQSSRQLGQLFSGKVVTLKRGLTEEQANRFISVIQMLGGICRKESELKNFFEESEFKQRKTVSFLEEDFDPSSLSLAPKDEFSTEV